MLIARAVLVDCLASRKKSLWVIAHAQSTAGAEGNLGANERSLLTNRHLISFKSKPWLLTDERLVFLY